MIKLFNLFWGLFAVLIATTMVYAFYEPLVSLAGMQPTNETKMIAFAGVVIIIVFLVIISPISNFIADDQGRL